MPRLILHSHFYLPLLDSHRTLRVLVPRNFAQSAHKRYPVFYFQDGQNLFDAHTAYFRHWRLREMMASQPLKRQAILVGIDNGHQKRISEYAPHNRGRRAGAGEAYLHSIIHTIKPYIDSQYPTLSGPIYTGICGSSMGGLISLYAGLNYSHIFGRIGVLSPSLWYDPELYNHTMQILPHTKFYISASRTEMGSMAHLMQKTYWALKRAGVGDERLQVKIKDRGRHSEVLWAAESKHLYEFLYPDFTINS